jgi:hypothetical protein
MGVGGMMGGMFGGDLNTIKHDSWAGAIWGGTKAAASNFAPGTKTLVTGQAEFKGADGKSQQVPVKRLDSLKWMASGVDGAFRSHTFSMRDPEGFKNMQNAVAKF